MKKHDILLESLAALEHEQWRHWRGNIEKKFRIPHSKSLEKTYEQLTENEKEMDRIFARKTIRLIIANLHRIIDESDYNINGERKL